MREKKIRARLHKILEDGGGGERLSTKELLRRVELDLACEWERAVAAETALQAERDYRNVHHCPACSVEAEFGTEEDPHPVEERLHRCAVRQAQRREWEARCRS